MCGYCGCSDGTLSVWPSQGLSRDSLKRWFYLPPNFYVMATCTGTEEVSNAFPPEQRELGYLFLKWKVAQKHFETPPLPWYASGIALEIPFRRQPRPRLLLVSSVWKIKLRATAKKQNFPEQSTRVVRTLWLPLAIKWISIQFSWERLIVIGHKPFTGHSLHARWGTKCSQLSRWRRNTIDGWVI